MKTTKELRICSSTPVHVTATWVTKWQPQADCHVTTALLSAHEAVTVRLPYWLTACNSSKPVSFLYYFLRFISSLVYFLSFSVFFSPLLYFISSLPRASTSYIYLPISSHPLFIHRSCFVRPFLFSFLPVFLCSSLFILSIGHIFIRFFINFLLFLGSFLPSFVLHLLFLYSRIRISLFTLGRLYSHFPSFDTTCSHLSRFTVSLLNPFLLRTDRRCDCVRRSAGKCTSSASDMGKGPEPLSTAQVSPSLQKFVFLLDWIFYLLFNDDNNGDDIPVLIGQQQNVILCCFLQSL